MLGGAQARKRENATVIRSLHRGGAECRAGGSDTLFDWLNKIRPLILCVENEPNYQNATRTMIDGYLPRGVRIPNFGKSQLICAFRHPKSLVYGRRVEGGRLRRGGYPYGHLPIMRLLRRKCVPGTQFPKRRF